jgi:hypothetical protein
LLKNDIFTKPYLAFSSLSSIKILEKNNLPLLGYVVNVKKNKDFTYWHKIKRSINKEEKSVNLNTLNMF